MKHTIKKMTRPTQLPTLYSQASDWRELRDFIFDALADTMHHSDVLRGARPELNLMLSRRFLPAHQMPPQQVQRHLENISRELRRHGVFHTINMVVVGNEEPESHTLDITLRWP